MKNWEFFSFSKFKHKGGFMKESKIFSNQNLTEKVHYVYRVTIDEKYYIGKRSGFLNDLHTGAYTTSSKLVHEKLQNGHHFSKIKILRVFSTSEEALEFEKRILLRVNAKRNPKFLNQCNGNGSEFCLKQHTEETKKKMSKSHSKLWDENTERGRKNLENHRNLGLKQFDPNTESGQQNREDMSKIKIEYYKTERGIKTRQNHSEFMTERFNPNTEYGRKRRENHSEKMKEHFNPETEEGRKRRENKSQSAQAQFDKNTEQGIKRRENHSEIMKKAFDPNTEEGKRNRENMSKSHKARYNPDTEEGRRNLEIHSEIMKKGAKTQLQKRKDTSILGELMFDEAFIRENFLIIDDKNNQRFLWSVYSKLTGYKKSSIIEQKREGKLNFLYGIESISITEELENSKIREIEAIIAKNCLKEA